MRISTMVLVLFTSSLLACGQAPVATTTPPSPPPQSQPANPQPNPDPTPPPAPNPDPDPIDPAPPPPVPDTTAPTIASSSPEGNATGVSINSKLLVTFSEAMKPSSVTVSTNPSFNLGSATWKSENTAVEFDPPSDFAGDTSYTVNVNGQDVAGNALSGTKSFQFKTATIRDTTAPGIPQNLSAEAGDALVKLTWNANSESDLKGYTLYYGTDAGNLGSTTFISKPGTGKTLTGLTNGTKYFFQLAAEDGAGNKSNRSSTVNATPKDTTAPKLVSSNPRNNATVKAGDIAFTLIFNEPMRTETVTNLLNVSCQLLGSGSGSFVLQPNSQVWVDSKTLTFKAQTAADATSYQCDLEVQNAKDLAGNAMVKSTVRVTFTDNTPPSITGISPAANAVGQPTTSLLSVTFSEPMDRTSVQAAFKANFGLLGQGASVPGTFNWSNNDKDLIFKPNALLNFGEFVVWGLNAGAKDKSGNALPNNLTFIRGLRVIQQETVDMPYYGSGHIVRTCVNSVTACTDDTAYTGEGVIRIGDRKVTFTGLPPKPVYQYSRGYLAFKINGIRANATIINARLQVFHKSTGGNPFGQLGNLILERVNPSQTIEQAYKLSGNRGDFNLPALACATCPISIPSVTIDQNVTAFVVADRADGHAAAQFRLRFVSLVADANTADYLDYFQNPVLTVTYQFP